MDIAKIRKKNKKTKPENQDVNSEHQKHEETELTDSQQQEKLPEKNITQATMESATAEIQEEKGKEQAIEVQKEKEEFEEETTDEIIEILAFGLLKEEFAFKISQLEEIVRPQKITVVPKLPKYVLGITSLRGKIIPVLDLKVKLSLTDKSSDIKAKKKILVIKGPKGPIGAIIDRLVGVVRVGRNEIIPPPSHLTEAELKFIEGIAVVDKRFISIVNLEEAISINV